MVDGPFAATNAAPSYLGFAEEITARHIKGWIYDSRSPELALELRAFEGDREIGRTLADGFRPDLLAAAIGNGRHAFTLEFPHAPRLRQLRFQIGEQPIALNTPWPAMLAPAHFLADRAYSPYEFNTNQARSLLAACLEEPTGLSPFRLVGLMDAFCRLPAAARDSMRRVLSVGCGDGLHERYLGLFTPQAKLLATDLQLRPSNVSVGNIEFAAKNILAWPEDDGVFDFAFSIECLEHIPDYEAAFAAMARKVRPGGYLYLSVPFANESERADEKLRAEEFRLHEHVTPGFSAESLRKMAADNALDIEFVDSMFHGDLVPALATLLTRAGRDRLEEIAAELFMLARGDSRRDLVASRNEAFGIRLLARRR